MKMTVSSSIDLHIFGKQWRFVWTLHFAKTQWGVQADSAFLDMTVESLVELCRGGSVFKLHIFTSILLSSSRLHKQTLHFQTWTPESGEFAWILHFEKQSGEFNQSPHFEKTSGELKQSPHCSTTEWGPQINSAFFNKGAGVQTNSMLCKNTCSLCHHCLVPPFHQYSCCVCHYRSMGGSLHLPVGHWPWCYPQLCNFPFQYLLCLSNHLFLHHSVDSVFKSS